MQPLNLPLTTLIELPVSVVNSPPGTAGCDPRAVFQVPVTVAVTEAPVKLVVPTLSRETATSPADCCSPPASPGEISVVCCTGGAPFMSFQVTEAVTSHI